MRRFRPMFKLATIPTAAKHTLANYAKYGRNTVCRFCMNFLPWRAL